MSEVSQKQSYFDEFKQIPIKLEQTHNKMKKNELSRRQSYFDELELLPTKKHKLNEEIQINDQISTNYFNDLLS